MGHYPTHIGTGCEITLVCWRMRSKPITTQNYWRYHMVLRSQHDTSSQSGFQMWFPLGDFLACPGLNQRCGSCSIDFLDYLKVVSRGFRPFFCWTEGYRIIQGPWSDHLITWELKGMVTNKGHSRHRWCPLNAPLRLKINHPVQVILLHSNQLGRGIMAKVRAGESSGGSDDDSQGSQKPDRQALVSMTSRVGRNQMIGNVLDYQVYSSPIAYVSNKESAHVRGCWPGSITIRALFVLSSQFLWAVPLV